MIPTAQTIHDLARHDPFHSGNGEKARYEQNPYISADLRLEALRAELKQAINKDQTEAQNEPIEAQSALKLVPEEINKVDNAGTKNLQVSDLPPTVTAPAQEPAGPRRRRRHRRQLRINAEAWMPPGWKMITKVRKNGKTAGYVDKFYIGPTGRRCRSKNEALQYINRMNRVAEVSTPEA